MKKLLVIIFLATSFSSFAQLSAVEKDSIATSADYQSKVKLQVISKATNMLADTTQPNYVMWYAQKIVSEPSSSDWLSVFSYGAINNSIVSSSTDTAVYNVVSNLFIRYAKAYYRIVK